MIIKLGIKIYEHEIKWIQNTKNNATGNGNRNRHNNKIK